MFSEILSKILKEKRKISQKEIKKFLKLKDSNSLIFFIFEDYLKLYQKVNFEKNDFSLKKAIKTLEESSFPLEEKKKALIFLASLKEKPASSYLQKFKRKASGILKAFLIIASLKEEKFFEKNFELLLSYKDQEEALKDLFPFEFCNRRCETCPFKINCLHFQEEANFKISIFKKGRKEKLLLSIESRYAELSSLIYRKGKVIKIKFLDPKREEFKKIEKEVKKDPLFREFEKISERAREFFFSLFETLIKEGDFEVLENEFKEMLHFWLLFTSKARKIFFDFYFQKRFLRKDEKSLSHLISAANFLKNLSLYLVFTQRLKRKISFEFWLELSILNSQLKDLALKLEKRFPKLKNYLEKIFIN